MTFLSKVSSFHKGGRFDKTDHGCHINTDHSDAEIREYREQQLKGQLLRSARSISVLCFVGSGEVSASSVMASVTSRLGVSVFGLPRLDSLVGNLKLSIFLLSSRFLNAFSTGNDSYGSALFVRLDENPRR
jgi:hypothetical protein